MVAIEIYVNIYMDKWYYYSAMRSISLALTNVFGGIQIAKTGEDGSVKGMVDVPLKYGLKTKDFYFRTDYKLNPQLPMMGLTSTQVQYAAERATQKMGKIWLDLAQIDPNDPKVKILLNPSPWNFSYTLSIATKYVLEAEQILEQILPFFNPFLMISVPIEEIGFAYDCKVILGTVSEDKQDTMQEEDIRIINWTVELICHGYLFRPTQEVGLIKKVMMNHFDANNGEQLIQQEITEDNEIIRYKDFKED